MRPAPNSMGTDFNPGGFNPQGFNPGTSYARNTGSAGRTAGMSQSQAFQGTGGYAPTMPLSRGGATVQPPLGSQLSQPPRPPPMAGCCGGGYGVYDDSADQNGSVKEQSWMYVGEGGGTHEYVPSYVYVGKGSGAWVVDEKQVPKSGQMLLWGCGALLCFVLTAGITWLVLALVSGDVKPEELPGLTPEHQAAIKHHSGVIGGHIATGSGHVGNGISTAAGKAGEGISHLHEKAKPHLNYAGERIKHHAGNAWSNTKQGAGNAADWSKHQYDKHHETVKGHAQKIANDALDKSKELAAKGGAATKAGVQAGHEKWQTHGTEEAEEEEVPAEEPATSV